MSLLYIFFAFEMDSQALIIISELKYIFILILDSFACQDNNLNSPLKWCGYQDLNLGPLHYQCSALTN